MSRLDSFIRRLEAQRSCLTHAVDLLEHQPGPIFEFGLGNGRTYDHLRELFPDREVFVFERKVAAHPDCVPTAPHLFEGPIEETLPLAAEHFAGRVAMVHSDLGCGDPDLNAQLAAFTVSFLPRILCPGGYVMADQDLRFPEATAMPLPDGVTPGRYFIYRAPGI
ncbi:MAG: class I SAM-dependent methyltransferase [Pseudomonadota bacterium]